ncbi:hypothetical protein [Siccirubricoccus phaeus]|uniref:hypothetical protein n=1 Tax=Siccirubricoccus phaeus TaxID=2595053 RepID=UPI001A9CB11F|nr:hypothetical protein [Siccirubricoccus phaeus]
MEAILLWFILPLWLAAGVADWLCHRATHIATTTGAKESLMHIAMLGIAGVPVVAGLFLQVNALLIAVMLLAFLAHEAVALWDVSYATPRREVNFIEQHVHSFLELVPLMAIIAVVTLHWDQALALFGLGEARADWTLRWKEPPLPTLYVGGILLSILLLELLPYAEELWRCWRAGNGFLHPAPRRRPRPE